MLKARGAAALLAAVAIATAAGCGDGGEETSAEPAEDPAAVVTEFYAAVAAGDGDSLCDLISAEDVVEEEGETCEEQADGLVSGPFADALANAKVGETIEQTDETATVEVTVAGAKTDAELVNEDGEWRIDLAR